MGEAKAPVVEAPPPPPDIKVDPTRLHVIVLSCTTLEAGSFNFSLDPWVKVKLRDQRHDTPVTLTPSRTDPIFNFACNFHDVKERDVLTCIVYDLDASIFSTGHDSDLLGRIDVPLFKHRDKMLAGQSIRLTERLHNQAIHGKAKITISMKFAAREEEPRRLF